LLARVQEVRINQAQLLVKDGLNTNTSFDGRQGAKRRQKGQLYSCAIENTPAGHIRFSVQQSVFYFSLPITCRSMTGQKTN
jgi:hypothetical protein